MSKQELVFLINKARKEGLGAVAHEVLTMSGVKDERLLTQCAILMSARMRLKNLLQEEAKNRGVKSWRL